MLVVLIVSIFVSFSFLVRVAQLTLTSPATGRSGNAKTDIDGDNANLTACDLATCGKSMSCSLAPDQPHHFASSELSMQLKTLQRLPNNISYPSKYRSRMDNGPYKQRTPNDHVCPCCGPPSVSDQQMLYGPPNGHGAAAAADLYHHPYPPPPSQSHYPQQHCVFHAGSQPPPTDRFYTPSPSVQPFLPGRVVSPVRLTPICTCQHGQIIVRDEHFYSLSSAGSDDEHGELFIATQNSCFCDSSSPKPTRPKKKLEGIDLKRELQEACNKCDMQTIQEARNYVVRQLLHQAMSLMGDDDEMCKCSGGATSEAIEECCAEEESVCPMQITDGQECESQGELVKTEENSHCEACEEAAKLFEQQGMPCPVATITMPIPTFPCAIFLKPNAEYTDFSAMQMPLHDLNGGPQMFGAPFVGAQMGGSRMGAAMAAQMGGPMKPMGPTLAQADSVYFGSCDCECNDEDATGEAATKASQPVTEAAAAQVQAEGEAKTGQTLDEAAKEESAKDEPPQEEPQQEEPPQQETQQEEPQQEEPPQVQPQQEVPPQEEAAQQEPTPTEAAADSASQSEPQTAQPETQTDEKRASTSSQRRPSAANGPQPSEFQGECDPDKGRISASDAIAQYECDLDDAECEAARAELYKKLQSTPKRLSCSTAGGGSGGALGASSGKPCDCCHCRAVRNANKDTSPESSMAVARLHETCGAKCGGGGSGHAMGPTGSKQGSTAAPPDYSEMKFFIDSLVLDFEVMETIRKEMQQAKSSGGRSSGRALMRPLSLCQRPSFPVTITNVSNVGTKALFVKWEIHDCAGIGGYEIYLDNCFYNRYRSSDHQAALIYNVNIREEHTITLRAVTHDEITAPPDCSCGDAGKKSGGGGGGAFGALFGKLQSSTKAEWTPSVYLYDPNARGMLKGAAPPKCSC